MKVAVTCDASGSVQRTVTQLDDHVVPLADRLSTPLVDRLGTPLSVDVSDVFAREDGELVSPGAKAPLISGVPNARIIVSGKSRTMRYVTTEKPVKTSVVNENIQPAIEQKKFNLTSGSDDNDIDRIIAEAARELANKEKRHHESSRTNSKASRRERVTAPKPSPLKSRRRSSNVTDDGDMSELRLSALKTVKRKVPRAAEDVEEGELSSEEEDANNENTAAPVTQSNELMENGSLLPEADASEPRIVQHVINIVPNAPLNETPPSANVDYSSASNSEKRKPRRSKDSDQGRRSVERPSRSSRDRSSRGDKRIVSTFLSPSSSRPNDANGRSRGGRNSKRRTRSRERGDKRSERRKPESRRERSETSFSDMVLGDPSIGALLLKQQNVGKKENVSRKRKQPCDTAAAYVPSNISLIPPPPPPPPPPPSCDPMNIGNATLMSYLLPPPPPPPMYIPTSDISNENLSILSRSSHDMHGGDNYEHVGMDLDESSRSSSRSASAYQSEESEEEEEFDVDEMRQLLLQQVKMQRNSGSNTPQKAADHGRGSSANEQQQRRLSTKVSRSTSMALSHKDERRPSLIDEEYRIDLLELSNVDRELPIVLNDIKQMANQRMKLWEKLKLLTTEMRDKRSSYEKLIERQQELRASTSNYQKSQLQQFSAAFSPRAAMVLESTQDDANDISALDGILNNEDLAKLSARSNSGGDAKSHFYVQERAAEPTRDSIRYEVRTDDINDEVQMTNKSPTGSSHVEVEEQIRNEPLPEQVDEQSPTIDEAAPPLESHDMEGMSTDAHEEPEPEQPVSSYHVPSPQKARTLEASPPRTNDRFPMRCDYNRDISPPRTNMLYNASPPRYDPESLDYEPTSPILYERPVEVHPSMLHDPIIPRRETVERFKEMEIRARLMQKQLTRGRETDSPNSLNSDPTRSGLDFSSHTWPDEPIRSLSVPPPERLLTPEDGANDSDDVVVLSQERRQEAEAPLNSSTPVKKKSKLTMTLLPTVKTETTANTSIETVSSLGAAHFHSFDPTTMCFCDNPTDAAADDERMENNVLETSSEILVVDEGDPNVVEDGGHDEYLEDVVFEPSIEEIHPSTVEQQQPQKENRLSGADLRQSLLYPIDAALEFCPWEDRGKCRDRQCKYRHQRDVVGTLKDAVATLLFYFPCVSLQQFSDDTVALNFVMETKTKRETDVQFLDRLLRRVPAEDRRFATKPPQYELHEPQNEDARNMVLPLKRRAMLQNSLVE